MIKTQEQYDKIMKSAHNLVAGSFELEATFNALRKVAVVQMRSAKKFYADHVYPHALEDFDEWLKIAHPDLSALSPFLIYESE